jgi:hypothetical protein
LCFALISVSALLVFATCSFQLCFGVNDEDALSAISSAEDEVLACYQAAADAERAGANVSDLLNVLNEAGWLLSRAKIAYNQGDFDSAFALANESQTKLSGFKAWAEDLKQKAEQANERDFMINFVGSPVGAICIVFGGFVLWTLLKGREKVKEKT